MRKYGSVFNEMQKNNVLCDMSFKNGRELELRIGP
jgi:hypothetical protein